jgi:hypothetical protein
MYHDRARIKCPRCGVNNFTGQTNCWKCSGSLPPPEAVSPPAVFPQPQAAMQSSAPARVPARRGSRWMVIVPVALLILVLAGALFWFASRRHAQTGAIGDIAAQLDALNAQKERILRQNPPALSDPSVLDPDSETARARRELQRLEKKLGNSLPPTDAQGRVHLQGGGTLSAEE